MKKILLAFLCFCCFIIVGTAQCDPDIEAPVITQCAPNAVMNYSNNCTGVTSNWTSLVVATDNCDSSLDISQSPVAGTVLSGLTIITITVTDASGNVSTCSFNVTLIDNTLPEIVNCPTNQTLVLDASCEAELPNYLSEIEVNDNCTFLNNVTQNPVQGTVVSENTIVTVTATDDNGNTTTCQFEVITQPESAQAIAQMDFDTCSPTNAITANQPPMGYTGLWSFVQGSGSFEDATSASTTVTFNASGEMILQWKLTGTDEGCGFPISVDQLTVLYFTADCQTVNAGIDMDVCSTISSVQLNTNPAVFPAIGAWTIVSGTGSIADATDPNTVVSGLALGTTVLRWSIPASECCPETFDEISINVFDCPICSVDAGADIMICMGDIAMLQANVISTGTTTITWSPSASLSNSNILNPIAMPMSTTVYSINILDELGCMASDQVSVSVIPLPAVNAGPDMTVCVGGLIDLEGSPSNGIWSGQVVTEEGLFSATETGNYSLAYTFINGMGCAEYDEMDVTVLPVPIIAEMADIILCENQTIELCATATIDFGNISFYEWLDGPNTACYNVAPTMNTSYFVAAISDMGCSSTLQITINMDTNEGCIDPLALNYDPNAACDNGLCNYEAVAGDLDGDGIISMEEFNTVLAAFGCTMDCDQLDLDGDGIVGMSDMLILIANMGG